MIGISQRNHGKPPARGNLVGVILILLLSFIPRHAGAKKKEGVPFVGIAAPWRFLIHTDNDTLFNTDEAYTNGLRLDFFNIGEMGNWAKSISKHLIKNGDFSISGLGIVVGQGMYSPIDITKANLIRDDRPYGGWLYVGAYYQLRTKDWELGVEATFGLIGPYSFAGDLQYWWHQTIGAPLPRGWDHQLPTEPAVYIAAYWKKHLFSMGTDRFRFFDLNANTRVEFGNIFIRTAGHLLFRIGYIGHNEGFMAGGPAWLAEAKTKPLEEKARIKELEARLKTAKDPKRRKHLERLLQKAKAAQGDANKGTRSKKKRVFNTWEIYIFAKIGALLSLHNIFVNGSLFQKSHKVKLFPGSFDAEIGLVLKLYVLRIQVGSVFRTKEGEYPRAPVTGHQFYRINFGVEW